MIFWCSLLMLIAGHISGNRCFEKPTGDLGFDKSITRNQNNGHPECNTLLYAHVNDIAIEIAGKLYTTAVQWDPYKGVFNAETFLKDIPSEKANSTVLFLLQTVNSFALEFHSCQYMGTREYWIQLQVDISGTKLNINSAVSRDGTFVEASITVLDVFYPKIGAQLTWNGWSDLALIVTGRIVAGNRNGGYISSVGHVVTLAGHEAQLLINQYQGKLEVYAKRLEEAKLFLQEKQQTVRSANFNFDDQIKKLEYAKDQMQVTKHDFQLKRKEFQTMQEKLEKICDFEICRNVCVPGIKYKGYNINEFDCGLRRTDCMFEMVHPMCILTNAWCWATNKRGAAFVSLGVVQGAVRVAELSLDGANYIVTGAQVAVDKSWVVRDVALAGLKTVEMGLGELQLMIEMGQHGLEALTYLVDVGVNVTSLIVEEVSENVIDARNCGMTLCASSNAVWESGIELFCEVNYRGSGYRRMSRSLRLYDIYRLIKSIEIGAIE